MAIVYLAFNKLFRNVKLWLQVSQHRQGGFYIVFGKALVLKEEKIVLDTQKISEDQVEAEVARFYAGREAAVEQLNSIHQRALKSLGEEKSGHLWRPF